MVTAAEGVCERACRGGRSAVRREHGLFPEDPQHATVMPLPAEGTDEGRLVREGKMRTVQCQASQEKRVMGDDVVYQMSHCSDAKSEEGGGLH